MINNISFHDFYITGILHNRFSKKLFIQTESISGNKILLNFSSVDGWDLSPFEDQNILFNIQEFDKKNLPEWIKKDFEVPKEFLNSIDSEEKRLYYLEPSIGLGGYVIASKAEDTKVYELGSNIP